MMKYFGIVVLFFLSLSSTTDAQQFLSGEQGPTFYQNGVPQASAVCGDTIAFDVPGIFKGTTGSKEIWLGQYKTPVKGPTWDWIKTYDSTFTIPMSAYQTRCGYDEGTFHNYIYEAVRSGDTHKQGSVIMGYTAFSIGSANEARISTLDQEEEGIFSMKVSRNDPVISSGYFYADAAIEDFLAKYTDDTDAIILVPADSLLSSINTSSLCDCSWRWRYPATGIGDFPINRVSLYDGQGRFFHVVQAPWINEFTKGNKTLGETLWLLSHEVGHGWSAYYSDVHGMLDEFRAHWAKTFSHQNSIMGRGSGVSDSGDGTFSWSPSAVENRVFNDFDLYNMGLLRSDEVKDSFSIESPVELSDTRYSGVKKTIAMGPLINSIGARNPATNFSAFNQSKNLRITFLVMQGPSGSEEELQNVRKKVRELSVSLPSKWSTATRNLSSLSVYSPLPKVSKNPFFKFLSSLQYALLPKALFVSTAGKDDFKEIISNLEVNLRNAYDHNFGESDFETVPVNFDGDDRLRLIDAVSPNTSLAPLNLNTPRPLRQPTLDLGGLISKIKAQIQELLRQIEELKNQPDPETITY